ncbi:MAG TPA: hypothetical protein VFQ27_12130 [Xanthobacteraceae bacterium]|nr:hypothetical protein [Xanthobacteraceae bacterium]
MFDRAFATKIRPWNDSAFDALASTRVVAWRLAPGLRPDQARAADDVIAAFGVYQMLANPVFNVAGLPAAFRPALRDRQRAAAVTAIAALGRVGLTVWWREVYGERVELYVVPIRPVKG